MSCDENSIVGWLLNDKSTEKRFHFKLWLSLIYHTQQRSRHKSRCMNEGYVTVITTWITFSMLHHIKLLPEGLKNLHFVASKLSQHSLGYPRHDFFVGLTCPDHKSERIGFDKTDATAVQKRKYRKILFSLAHQFAYRVEWSNANISRKSCGRFAEFLCSPKQLAQENPKSSSCGLQAWDIWSTTVLHFKRMILLPKFMMAFSVVTETCNAHWMK